MTTHHAAVITSAYDWREIEVVVYAPYVTDVREAEDDAIVETFWWTTTAYTFIPVDDDGGEEIGNFDEDLFESELSHEFQVRGYADVQRVEPLGDFISAYTVAAT